MKNRSIFLVTLIILLTNLQIQAQEVRNKGSLQVYKNEFYEEIQKVSKEFSEKEKVLKIYCEMFFSFLLQLSDKLDETIIEAEQRIKIIKTT